jgi:hypothetical protein
MTKMPTGSRIFASLFIPLCLVGYIILVLFVLDTSAAKVLYRSEQPATLNYASFDPIQVDQSILARIFDFTHNPGTTPATFGAAIIFHRNQLIMPR